MGGCSIRRCKVRSVKGGSVRFFTFPKNESVANEWLRFCRPNTKKQNGKVCSEHFKPSDYVVSLRQVLMNETHKKRLSPDAVPTLHLNYNNFVDQQQTLNKKKVVDLDIAEDFNNIKSISNKISQHNTIANNRSVLKKYIINVDNTEDSSDKADWLSLSDTIEINTEAKHVRARLPFDDDENSDDETITIPLAKYKKLKKTAKEHTNLKNNLTKIFTPGQIRVLMDPKRSRIQWSKEDISSAIWLLRNIRPHAYRHMKFNVGLPLPAFSTLRNWASKHRVEVTSLPSAEHDYVAINMRDFTSLEPKRDRKAKKKFKHRVKQSDEASEDTTKPRTKVKKKIKPQNQPVSDEPSQVIFEGEAITDFKSPKLAKIAGKVRKKEKPPVGTFENEMSQGVSYITIPGENGTSHVVSLIAIQAENAHQHFAILGET